MSTPHTTQGAKAPFLRSFMHTERGERLLLVETSGTENFEYVREFYCKNGYEEEARIREFYTAGVDKIVFRKALN